MTRLTETGEAHQSHQALRAIIAAHQASAIESRRSSSIQISATKGRLDGAGGEHTRRSGLSTPLATPRPGNFGEGCHRRSWSEVEIIDTDSAHVCLLSPYAPLQADAGVDHAAGGAAGDASRSSRRKSRKSKKRHRRFFGQLFRSCRSDSSRLVVLEPESKGEPTTNPARHSKQAPAAAFWADISLSKRNTVNQWDTAGAVRP